MGNIHHIAAERYRRDRGLPSVAEQEASDEADAAATLVAMKAAASARLARVRMIAEGLARVGNLRNLAVYRERRAHAAAAAAVSGGSNDG